MSAAPRPNRLTILAAEIQQAHADSTSAKARAVGRARDAGAGLIEAKGLVGYGEWLPWLKTINMPVSTAVEYMRVARLNDATLTTVVNLGLRAALEAVRAERRQDPAALRPTPAREGADFWPTPSCLTAALVRHVLPALPSLNLWECAAGDGRLTLALTKAGANLLATDREPQGIGIGELDFILGAAPGEAAGRIVVTNPPGNQLDQFISRGLELFDSGLTAGLVLLLRHDHLQGSERVDILNRATWEVHCNWRPLWIADTDGNPRWSYRWVVWLKQLRRPPLYLRQSDVEEEQDA